MRVHLSDEDAAIVRRCLEHPAREAAVLSGDAARLVKAFTPTPTLTAVLRPAKNSDQWIIRAIEEPEDDDRPRYWSDDDGWTDYDHADEYVRAENLPIMGEWENRADPVPTCPECGGQAFGYVEGTEQYWSPHPEPVRDGVVGLCSEGWDGVGDGDGDPGLFCDHYRGGGCGTPIILPEGWEYQWD